MYDVPISKTFNARQGLKSPVRGAKQLSSSVPDTGFSITIRVGIAFEDSQLNARGWFVDTDALEEVIQSCCNYLISDNWTHLFKFRPTFELVSKWAFDELNSKVPQLRYVELENNTVEVKTKYFVNPK